MLKLSICGITLALFSTLAVAQGRSNFEVAITNITIGQTFTPQLVMTHSNDYRMFELGSPASAALEMMAEGGDTGPLTDEVANFATAVRTVAGLLGPGETATTVVRGNPGQDMLSVAAMLIPTNDAFLALNGIPLPRFQSAEYLVPAYDAGSEANDQSCQHMPGPVCGGEGFVEGGGEGFVHVSNGFHDLGDQDEDGFEILGPQGYDWRNPVARIVVTRIRR